MHLFQELSSSSQINKHEDIIRLISDQHTRKIIDAIQMQPKSAMQISKESGIELSSIYRRLHKLQKLDLMKITFKITHDGEKSFYYQSKISSVIAKYQEGKFYVNLDFN